MKTLIKSKPILSFFVLTFAFTWLWWGLVYALQLPLAAGYVPFLIGAAGPSLMAFAVSAAVGGRQEVETLCKRVAVWRVGIVWYLAALFIPALVALGAIGLHLLFGGTLPSFALLEKQWYLIPIALITGMLLGGPLEEEFGWRGFAMVHLQKRYSALTASVIVGILWGLWHLPAFLIPWSSQHGLPVIMFLLHDIALAILFTWIFNNTGGSIWMAMLAHAAFNLTITILPVTPSAAGSERPLAFAVMLLYIAAIIVILAFGARTLTRDAEHV
jgi:membrane protease YdiL (CAAX protease family)